MHDSSRSLPRFNPFEITDVVYKTINSHPIHASILIPHGIQPGKHPLMVRFHGGGFIEGVRLGDWFRPWLLDFCAREGAILVSPDYQLIPESTGYDMLEDTRDFWKWVVSDLQKEIYQIDGALDIDLDRVAVTGESAGGYLAVQSFCHPQLRVPRVNIRVVPIQGPLLDLTTCGLPASRPIFDMPIFPKDTAQKYFETTPKDTILTSWEPGGKRSDVTWSMAQHGTFLSAIEGTFGGDTRGAWKTADEKSLLRPVDNLILLKESDPDVVPPVWLVHAWQDCVVPIQGTWNFMSRYKELFPKAQVLLDLFDGDHGLDGDWPLDSPEVKRGLEWMKKQWLE